MPPRKKRFSPLPCSVCEESVPHLRRHTNRTHLPWYMCPAFACVDCQLTGDAPDLRRFHSGHGRVEGEYNIEAWYLLVNGYLLFIGKCLGQDSLDALLGLVVSQQLAASDPFLEEELFYLQEYDRLAGLEPDTHATYPPTRVSDLLHYKTLANLLHRMTLEDRTQSLNLQNYSNPDGSSPPSGHPVFKLHIMDAHFHLDQLIGNNSKTFKELEEQANSEITLIHAVTNFVFPGKWGQISKLIGTDSKFSFTLGVHPHLLYKNNHEYMFTKLKHQLETYPEAVAIGEIGLDFTTTCRCSSAHNRQDCVKGKIEAQYKFLEKSLLLADQLGKPVIIHCRDKGNGAAAKGVLDTFISLNLTHLRVQRHCFIGNSKEFDLWSSTLPNCYFSLSKQSTVDQDTREAILMSGHQRLLLETDSPYLSFPGDSQHGPWRIGKVAKAVSNILGMPVQSLIRISNKNISKLFSLNW